MRFLVLFLSSSFFSLFGTMIDPLTFNPPFYLCNKTEKPMYYAVCYERDQKQPAMKKIMPGHWVVRTDVNTKQAVCVLLSYACCPEREQMVDQIMIEPSCCKKINLEICPVDSTMRRSEPGMLCMRDYMICVCTVAQGNQQMCVRRCGKECYLLPGNIDTESMATRTVCYNPAMSSCITKERMKELTSKDIEKLERELITVKYLQQQAHTNDDMPEVQRLEKELMYIRYLLKARYPDWFPDPELE